MVSGGWTRELVHEIALWRRLAGARTRGQIAYPVSFLLQVLSTSLLFFAESVVVVLLFRQVDRLGGWRLAEIAFLYGISSLAIGCAITLGSGLVAFPDQIRQGSFDQVLTRPASALVQVLTAEIRLDRLGRVVTGTIVSVYALMNLEVTWTLGRLLYLPVVLVSAIGVFGALFLLEATLCFWTTQGLEVINAFTFGGATLSQYPLHLFEGWLRRVFLFAIPLGLVIYAPSLYLLDKDDPVGLPVWSRFIAPVVAVLFAALAGVLWGVGVRRYRSTGS